MTIRNILAAGMVALCAPLFATPPARAEVTEVKLAQQFSFAYLHINVMKHQQLIEKHAALLGGSNAMMIGQTLWTEFFQNKDWPVASAIAIALLVILLFPILIYERLQLRDLQNDPGDR